MLQTQYENNSNYFGLLISKTFCTLEPQEDLND